MPAVKAPTFAPPFTLRRNPFEFGPILGEKTEVVEPCDWIEKNLGVELHSNQIEIVEAYHIPKELGFNIIGCRGSGKTQATAWGLIELACNVPGTKIIIAAPIEDQAGRIIRYMKEAMQSDWSRVRDEVDWNLANAHRLPFRNGSVATAVSGQENANPEGEHGNVLVVEEAQNVPAYSVTNKLLPMIRMRNGYSKVIKLGTAIGRSHFYKSCMAKGSRTLVCRWDQAEIYLDEPEPFFYHGKQYSRELLTRMPVPLRVKMFPDLPKMHEATGYELTELDWLTQYAMEWVADINNVLSDEDQERVAGGKHRPLTNGRSGDTYFGGLDTAYSDKPGADSTKLCIWRLRKDGVLEKVASFCWQGKVLVQEQELWDILNPKTGIFKVEAVMADNSNIAIDIIQRFRAQGVPIVGVQFAGSAHSQGSAKNWKNTLVDHFIVRLQTGEVVYPDIKQMKLDAPEADDAMRAQIDGILEDYNQWCFLQRIRSKGRGINDIIEAPKEQQETEDGKENKSTIIHDDGACADYLAVYAAKHRDFMRKEMAAGGVGVIYDIPAPVIGRRTMGTRPQGSDNPFSPTYAPGPGRDFTAGFNTPAGDSSQGGRVDIGGVIGLNKKRR